MRQADKRRISLRALLLYLVALGSIAAVYAAAQTPTTPPGQTKATAPGQTPNPKTDTQNPNQPTPPTVARQRALPDYRTTQDPRLPIAPASDQKLPLFGYSFFAPARQAIEFRRIYLTRMLFGAASIALSGGAAPNTAGQIVGAGLTDAQKLDIFNRLQNGTLTPEEKRQYGALLAPAAQPNAAQPAIAQPNTVQPLPALPNTTQSIGSEAPTPQQLADFQSLSDSQKLDLVTRMQTGTLTAEEKSKYGALLNTTPSQGGVQFISPVTGQPVPQALYPFLQQGMQGFPLSQANAAQLPDLNAYREIADPLSQLYRNVSASVPANYQLSAGDSITLRYWSRTMEVRERTLTVDSQGAIIVPEIGRVIVLGQTVAQAEAALRERLSHYYRDVQVSVSLKELRTMPVTISGYAFSPGTYQVPVIATALNMVSATGGPTEDGTLRKIEIRRGGKLLRYVDFYRFMITGDATTDVTLLPGDVIFIPGHGARVAVRGEVPQPAIYETIPGETLRDVLRYAGGVKPSGVQQHVSLMTVQPGAVRIVKDVDVRDLPNRAPVPVYDGDEADVFSLRPEVTNQVTITGAVDQPGEYGISPGMTVADLVERARGLVSDAYPQLAHLFRWNPDNTRTVIDIDLEKALARDPAANIALLRWDELNVYTREQIAFTGRREVTARGAVVKEGVYDRSDNMRVKDLLVLAGGTRPEAFIDRAVLLHQRADGTYAYDTLSLARAMQGDPADNLLLQNRDILDVYRADEVHFTPQHTVSVQGEVYLPGTYPRGQDMRLSMLLSLAGGLNPSAGDQIVVAHAHTDRDAPPEKVTYSRSSGQPTPDPVLHDEDVVTVQGRGSYQAKPRIVTVDGAVNTPGPIVLSGENTRLTDVIKEAGGLRPVAYPEGAAFYRDAAHLGTGNQKEIGNAITKLSDLLNIEEYRREKAKSEIDRLKAVGSALNTQAPVSIPGVTPTETTGGAGALGPGAARVFQNDMVSPARSLGPQDLTAAPNVAVNVVGALKKPGGPEDILMQDGDHVTIPERPTTIEVIGAVLYPRAVEYREGAKLDYYVSETGGYAADAARDRTVVIRLGGGLAPIKKVTAFKPGDVILVPTHPLAARLTSHTGEIDSIFRNLTTSALIILVAKKIFGL